MKIRPDPDPPLCIWQPYTDKDRRIETIRSVLRRTLTRVDACPVCARAPSSDSNVRHLCTVIICGRRRPAEVTTLFIYNCRPWLGFLATINFSKIGNLRVSNLFSTWFWVFNSAVYIKYTHSCSPLLRNNQKVGILLANEIQARHLFFSSNLRIVLMSTFYLEKNQTDSTIWR